MSRPQIIAQLACCILSVTFATQIALTHGPIPEQITRMDRRIEQDPNNAKLYLHRGELHRVRRAWSPALADYGRAASLDPDLDAVHLCRGMMFLEAGWPASAKHSLDRFLSGRPDHARGRITRARAMVRLRRYAEAVDDYTRAIASLRDGQRPAPAYYLERARAQIARGDAHRHAALAGLDEGITRLGPLVTLELLAIELELERHRYDEALARLGRIAAQSQRKDKWTVRRGEILEQAGRTGEARAAYAQALKQLQSLSIHRRRSPATVQRENDLKNAIARLAIEKPPAAQRADARKRKTEP